MTNRSDPDHKEVVDALEELIADHRVLFTTNFVCAEAYTLLGARLDWDIARVWLRDFDVPMARVFREDEDKAVALLLSYDDKPYSFVDATSFIVMDRLSVETAFTLDEDFRHHGYNILP